MAYSTDVATFTQILGPFYEYVADMKPIAEGEEENEENVSDSGVEETPSKYEGSPNLKELLGQYDEDDSSGNVFFHVSKLGTSLIAISRIFSDDLEKAHTILDDSVKSIQDELLEAKKIVDDFRNSFNESEAMGEEDKVQKTILPPQEKAPPIESQLRPSVASKQESVGHIKVSQHQPTLISKPLDVSEDEDEDVFEDSIEPEFFMVKVKNLIFATCMMC